MTEDGRRAAPFFAAVLGGMALCAVVAVYMPRALSFLPGLIGLLAVMAWPFFTGGARPWSRVALGVAGLAVAMAAVSALWAIDSGDALERAGKLAAVLLPGALIVGVAVAVPHERLAKFWWLIPGAVGIAAVLLNFEYMTDMVVFRAVRGIDAAAVVDRYELNRASVALVLLMVPCVGVVYAHMRRAGHDLPMAWARAGLYAALFVPMVSETESQTAQLVFIAGLLMLGVFPAWSRRAWQGLALLLAAGIMAAPFIAQYLFTLVPPPGTVPPEGLGMLFWESNAFARLEIWDFVSRYAMQNPLIGFGIEATRMVPAFDSKEIYQPGLTVLHPHNGALQVWIEFGVVGAVLAAAGAWMMLTRVVAGVADVMGRRIAGASFAGAVIVALTSYGLWQGWWLGLIMLLVAVTVVAVRGLARESA